MRRFLTFLLGALVLLLFACVLIFKIKSSLKEPEVVNIKVPTPISLNDSTFIIGNNWLRKNEFGIWEMYLEGKPYQRGLIYGALAKELIQLQEDYFVEQLNVLLPSKNRTRLLKLFTQWFNRDIENYIPEEYQKEIFGISKFFSDEYDYIGPKYHRILNYHAAHDIGHALQDLNMVGCTSFAVRNEKSTDSSLLAARNFDFYMGDKFAENKLIVFIKPSDGHAFTSYSWAGFTGVVSGMNEQGLAVTINASKSDIPFKAKTPISILTRKILQYAGNISEALDIAENHETFVSESLMISSASDNKTVIIEKTPKKTTWYAEDGNSIICTNHYQSKEFLIEEVNQKNIENSDSEYRFRRVKQLLDSSATIDEHKATQILRNRYGIDDVELGMGNPKAINQLIAHHAVVFKPQKKLVWYSAEPWQIGKMVAYDLDSIFNNPPPATTPLHVSELNIPADSFLHSAEIENYYNYLDTKQKLHLYLIANKSLHLQETEIEDFVNSNRESYVTYMLLGDYFKKKKDCTRAAIYYNKALTKEVASLNEINTIKLKLKKCLKKE